MRRDLEAKLYDGDAGKIGDCPSPGASAQNRYASAFNLLEIARQPCYYDTVIRSFADQGTEDIFDGKNTASARRCCPQSIWKVAYRKLDQLDSSTKLIDLRIPPGNRLEELSGNRKGQHSIRINDQYRVCFNWTDTDPEEVEIVDYHQG